VDSKPVYHLSPETKGVVVNHFLCSGRTPVLEHSARPCSDKRRNFCVSTEQLLRPLHPYELHITVWTQLCDPRCWGNVDEKCGLIRGRNTLILPMGKHSVLCRLKTFVGRAVRKTVARRCSWVNVFDVASKVNYVRWKWRCVLTFAPLRLHTSWGHKVHSRTVVFARTKSTLIKVAIVGRMDDFCVTILDTVSTDFIFRSALQSRTAVTE
jgi:hypothetical protein